MLKLPKGLKKKKKGKKSKKDKELFTEEELEQYRREHQRQSGNELGEADTSAQSCSTSANLAASPSASHTDNNSDKPDDDEWSKFSALTAGVDSILKKTQGDLDRIKSTSFFQRVPPPSEKKKKAEQEEKLQKAAKEEEEKTAAEQKKEEEKDNLAGAVIELSESESESEEGDDIFDTTYIDAIASGEVPLAFVPESPVDDFDDGPDPFDTSYAEKLIKGPEVSKRGKKLVSIGSAVEVLTGRVENISSSAVSRRQRRGPQNLLLENFDETNTAPETETVNAEPVITLLDDLTDSLIPNAPIDLSVSLHLVLQKEHQEQKEAEEKVKQEELSIVNEFDTLKKDEFDEFAQLAAESLTKKEEVVILNHPDPFASSELTTDWAAFEEHPAPEQQKVKSGRPPRPTTGPTVVTNSFIINESELEFEEDIDPFDTTFVEKVFSNNDKVDDEDIDFDPRANESPNIIKEELNLRPIIKDLLSGSTTDLSELPEVHLAPALHDQEKENIDPFDTSAVTAIVAPCKIELQFLEKELLSDNSLKHSLSDPDFDPRADIEVATPKKTVHIADSPAKRKSSLNLNIAQAPKIVSFATDFLSLDVHSNKIQKPLTPYYNKQSVLDTSETEEVDPFDTSFVGTTKPTDIELKNLEKDLLNQTLTHSISDPDFDPRAITPVAAAESYISKSNNVQSDLLSISENHNTKVLTPAEQIEEIRYVDPFDTSIASNIVPGKTELKLLENELLADQKKSEQSFDILSETQESLVEPKVLTPQLSRDIEEQEEIDPFDTSFASNLGPGRAEIKVIETELIDRQ